MKNIECQEEFYFIFTSCYFFLPFRFDTFAAKAEITQREKKKKQYYYTTET